MREGVHSGNLWAVARTPLFCSHFHKACRGFHAHKSGWGSARAEACPYVFHTVEKSFPYRGKLAKYFSIAWKTGCRGSISSYSGRRRCSAIHFSSCCEAERQRSGDATPCGGYPATPCSALFINAFAFFFLGGRKFFHQFKWYLF